MTQDLLEKVQAEVVRYEHPLVRFCGAPRRRGRGSGNPLQAQKRRNPRLHVPASSARDRAHAISLDIPETTLRLPARLHHRDVHAQSAAGELTTDELARPMPHGPTPLATILAEADSRPRPDHFRGIHGCVSLPSAAWLLHETPSKRRGAIISRASMPARYSAGFSLANFRKCGFSSGRPAEFCAGGTWRRAAGALAAQILDFAAESFPEFYGALQYVAVERSAAAPTAAETTLAQHLAAQAFRDGGRPARGNSMRLHIFK